MTLPVVQSLEDCASYAKTVEPFLDEFWSLPSTLLSRDGPTLLETYTNTNPLVSGLALSLVLGVVFLVLSELNDNYSQVDRCWSLLPTFYIAHFSLWARLAGLSSHRLDVVLLFSIIWSIRLTFNYARKGGYSVGSEDYRWEIVRKNIPSVLFHLLNWTFISFIQSVLLFLMAAPAYVILLASQQEPDVTVADGVFLAAELVLVFVEWQSDGQQWKYQAAKKRYLATAKVPAGFHQEALDRGFLAEGLWAYSRHPNFAAEQTIWLVLYQWSCYATQSVYGWAGVGAASLVVLFQCSTLLTEWITVSKYPEYPAYQKQIGMFVPTTFRGYKMPPIDAKTVQPKVLRTSELAKKANNNGSSSSSSSSNSQIKSRRVSPRTH